MSVDGEARVVAIMLLCVVGLGIAVGVLCLALSGCAAHPRQCLDSPCPPFADPGKDYSPQDGGP